MAALPGLCQPCAPSMRGVSHAFRVLVAVSHLAAAAMPCATLGPADASAAGHAEHHAEVALVAPDAEGSHAAHPCPEHAAEPAHWLAEVCPCGCGDAAPPGSASGRSGPALLASAVALPAVGESSIAPDSAPRLEPRAPHPPEAVPRTA